jgi:hypothetical protein
MGKCETQSCIDLARADFLAPDDPAVQMMHDTIFSHYGIRPEYKSIAICIDSTNSTPQ